MTLTSYRSRKAFFAQYSWIRKCKAYAALRRSVQKRDKFKCRLCGESNKIEMHHIERIYDVLKNSSVSFVNWRKHKKEILLQLKSKTNVLSGKNCITLCRNCHREVVTDFEIFWQPYLKRMVIGRQPITSFRKLLVLLPHKVLKTKRFANIIKYQRIVYLKKKARAEANK